MKALTIAIDASRTTVERVTGTEHYARELIRALIARNEQRETPHHLRLYFRDVPAPDLFPASEHVTQQVITLPRAWTHARFAAALYRDRPDLTFVPAHTLPVAFPGRAVVTVHDLGYKQFPAAHPPAQRLYLDATTRYSARRARLVLADSQATAEDLTRLYDVDPGKIRVVYPGVHKLKGGGLTALRRKYRLPWRYFLFLGTLQPRKNIARLVEAFDRFQHANPDENIGLVLAGGEGWLYDESWLGSVPNVYRPGYIDASDKGPLYAGALALVFPSLYEGFGFPAIEAMHMGTPVIASATSSLPELVGDAGVLVDPESITEIAAAMDLIAWRGDLRIELRSKGYTRATHFTWRRAADDALAVLEEAASDHPKDV